MSLHETFLFPNLSHNLPLLVNNPDQHHLIVKGKKLRRKNGKKVKSFDPRIETKNKYLNF